MNGLQDSYDDAVSALRNHIDGLGVWLAIWQARDDGKPDAPARRAANDAVDAIDGALAELHKIRQLLISEIRISDDATAARVDALLAARNQASPGHPARETPKPGALTHPGPSKKEHRYEPHYRRAPTFRRCVMKVYFNHRAALVEVILKFGFTDDILRSADLAEIKGVELRGKAPDPNEGCLMPPAGATIVLDIPEAELAPYEALAEGWDS